MSRLPNGLKRTDEDIAAACANALKQHSLVPSAWAAPGVVAVDDRIVVSL